MKYWEHLGNRIGALPARRVTWVLVLFFSIWVLFDVFVLKLTSGLAQSSYDAMVRSRVFVAAPDPRIVIVDIDEASLVRMGKEFGRWPWPRDVLATVLAHIERQEPAAVVWDILFSDIDRLNPGGDAAFNEAVRRSPHSHFSVVRLPKDNDISSQISQAALPGLWVTGLPESGGLLSVTKSTMVALIPPVLPAVVNDRLGYSNGYVDKDGVLRRYRYLEPLADGSAIQSLPLSVLRDVNLPAYDQHAKTSRALSKPVDELISWRRHANLYPRIPFADVFALADGDKHLTSVPTFAGKIVIIGATAPGLHDFHPTPLSPMHAGVDSLATVIDNAINDRHVAELSRGMQAGLAVLLGVILALWVQFKSVASLAPALLALPVTLVVTSYVSLNGFPTFLDLHLAAGLALVFLTILRYWNMLRRNHWCSPPPLTGHPLAIWAWERSDAWLEGPLDRSIDVLERHAPTCRVVVCDASAAWPSNLRWPELARYMAIVGPYDAMLTARSRLEPALKRLARRSGELLPVELPSNREKLARDVFVAWSMLQNGATDTN